MSYHERLGQSLARMAERLGNLLSEQESLGNYSYNDSPRKEGNIGIVEQLKGISAVLKQQMELGQSIDDQVKYEVEQLMNLCGLTKRTSSLITMDSTLEDFPMRPKQVISARACIVCGRDDRPGQQRKSGFKCLECIGTPNQGRFNVKVEEREGKKARDDEGAKTINDYTIISDLGKGSYGKVKMAVHTNSGMTYAIKILDKEKLRKVTKPGSNKTALDTVMQEIKILKALQHPNVVKLYEVIDEPGSNKLYLIMEFCEQGRIYTLNEEGFSTQGPIEKERLKKYIVAIAHGMQYLHDKGIIHRDVKPENILCDGQDHAKLADFGVSAITGETDVLTHTEGSPAFMPPEEYAHRPVSGTKADIWAFGVTIYAMAFGRLPFTGKDLKELGDSIMNDDPYFPKDCDPELEDLLTRMMEKDDEARITMRGILEHRYVEDVRTVKGQAVETVKMTICHKLLEPDLDVFSPDLNDYEAVLLEMPGQRKQGLSQFIKFLEDHGNTYQIVLPSPETCTLFAPRSTNVHRNHSMSRSYSSVQRSHRSDSLLASLDFMN